MNLTDERGSITAMSFEAQCSKCSLGRWRGQTYQDVSVWLTRHTEQAHTADIKLVRYNEPYAPKPTIETEPELMAALAEGWGIVGVTEETYRANGGGIDGPPTYASATYWAQMRKVQP